MLNCVLWVVCFIVYFFLTSLLCCGYAFLKHVTIVVPTLGASSKLPSAGIPLHHHHHQLSSHFFTKNTQEQKGNKIQTLFIGVCVLRGMRVCGQQGSKGSNSYGPPHHTRRTASTPFRPFTSPRNHKLYTGGKRRLWIRSLVTRDYEFSISFSVIVRIMCIASQRHGHGISMSF